MEKEKLAIINSPYYVDSVIDARNQGECIGYLLKGTEIRQVAAYFENPFSQEIQDLFSRSIVQDKDKTPVILRINELLLSTYYLSETYYFMVETNISFIINENGKYYELYNGMATSEMTGGFVAGPVSSLIANTLGKCYNGFLYNVSKQQLSRVEIPEGKLSSNPLLERKYPFERLNNSPEGIFYTFNDFLNGNVNNSRAIKVEYFPETESTPELTNIVFAQDNTWVGNIWGYSDGKRTFINIKDQYYPLYIKDSAFMFKALRKGTRLEDISPYIGMAFLGGMIGIMFGVYVVPIVPDPVKESVVECQVDLHSGLVIPASLAKYKEMNSRMILYMSRYQNEENEMEVYLDGELKCKLKRNTFYMLTIPPDHQKAELCLKSNGKELCETFTPVQYDAGVYICEIKKNQPPSRSEAKAEIRKSILDKIVTGDIERKCPDY